MIKDNIKKLTFFKKFLLSYLFILMIPMLIFSYAYNQVQDIVKNDAISSRLYLLRHLRESVDKYLTNIDESIITNALDNKLTHLTYLDQPKEGSSDMYWFFDYANSQKFDTLKNAAFDSSYYIFLDNNEAIFSSGRTSFGFMDYYKDYFNYKNLSFTQWYDIYFSDYHYKKIIPASKMRINGVEKSEITLLYSIPLNNNFIPSGVIAVLIDESTINKLLQEINIENKGFSYITDNRGTIITSSNGATDNLINEVDLNKSEGFFYKKISGQDMIVAYTKSSYNRWTYTTAIPVSAVMGNMKYLNKIFIILAIFSLLLGVLVSIFLSYNNTRIFKEIKNSLKDFFENNNAKGKPQENNDYDIIYGGISALIVNNQEMQKSLHKQLGTLKTIFIDRLLNGEFDSRQNMETLSSHVGVNLNGNYFTVSIIRINPQGSIISPQILEELDVIRILLEDILKKNIGEYYLIRILNENELAIITSLSANSIDESLNITKNALTNVREEFQNRYHIAPLCVIGNTYTDIMDIHYSFNEAKQILNYVELKKLNNDLVVWYYDVKKEFNLYFYPTDFELKLINYALSGNWNDLRNALDKIYEENFTNNPIDETMCKILFFDMQATLLKVTDEIEFKFEYSNQNFDLLSKEKPEIFFNWIKDSYLRICNFILKNKKSHNTVLKENILEYINDNYTNSNLSVCLVASYFNLSESYFSQFFKEQTGNTFTSYIEKLRIDLACSLIKEGTLSIEQISQKAGYNSTNSFRRAFKKVTGVVPTAFK